MNKAVELLEILANIRSLRISNEMTKQLYPDAVVGDFWVKTVDDLLKYLGLSESNRNLFWSITEP